MHLMHFNDYFDSLHLIYLTLISLCLLLQFEIERHLLFGKRLQATVWHSGALRRKVFLGEVLIPLDGWRLEDKMSQCFNWYPLCPKVKSQFVITRGNKNEKFLL